MSETRTDEAMLGRVRAALDSSVAELDPADRERLLLARRRALAGEVPQRRGRRWPMFATAAAAVLALAVGVVIQRPAEAPVGGSTLALAEDPVVLEWLLGEAAVEPAGDADFYAWLDEAEPAKDGGVADAG